MADLFKDVEQVTDRSPLLSRSSHDARVLRVQREDDVQSLLSSHLSKDELALGHTAPGERLPYNAYTTIDWLHDLAKDSYRLRSIRCKSGIRYRLLSAWESCQGWVAAALIGVITASIAFLVDVSVATLSDWKTGYCTANPFHNRDACCTDHGPGAVPKFTSPTSPRASANLGEDCREWHTWTSSYTLAFAIYTASALLFGVISASLTLLTKTQVNAVSQPHDMEGTTSAPDAEGKIMYLAAGSGIPEIKTILSGFVIPGILSIKVIVIKAVGATFAVPTGMCLGKEGPFVHISTCVAYQVAKLFPKYRDNSRKLREILSAGCASGLSVAFGAPIGGVLFSYEEISTYFPRKVMWRAFLCSLVAAMILKALNPFGTGRLVLFETSYSTTYEPIHYLAFLVLGIVGGIFGGTFCKANFVWSKSFRSLPLIKDYPVLEVFLVILATALLQYPNPMTREPGDVIIKNLLVDCRGGPTDSNSSWICSQETQRDRSGYVGWLVYGVLAKWFLTTVTFGAKVPSGIIIPALDGGAFFGRLLGQAVTSTISPGIFAMVGAAAFLAGMSRMTLSLVVIVFEMTGELEYVVPNMIAILVAKWIADALEKEGVYDLAQIVTGHPFLDIDRSLTLAQRSGETAAALLPPPRTAREITVDLPSNGCVSRRILAEKLLLLKRRGLSDAGLVLVHQGLLQGYLAEHELEFGLNELGKVLQNGNGNGGGGGWGGTGRPKDEELISLMHSHEQPDAGVLDLSHFVDRTPLTIAAGAPIEYAVEMFAKLGLKYLVIVEEGTARVLGVVIKKRLVRWLEEQNC